MRRFSPIPVPGKGGRDVRLQLELKHRMQIDQVLWPQERHYRGSKLRATGKKRIKSAERLIRRIAVAAVYVCP